MMSLRKIQLYGLEEKDQLIFSTLLGLLSSKTTDEWTVDNQGTSDVMVVDLDSDGAAVVADERELSGQKVIRMGVLAEKLRPDLFLGKPLRAADILRCLNSLNNLSAPRATAANTENVTPFKRETVEDGASSATQEQSATASGPTAASSATSNTSHTTAHNTGPGISTNTVVRMNRWPPKFMQAKTPFATRLCAVMMNHPISVGKAATMANAPLPEVIGFVGSCLEHRYAVIVPIGENSNQPGPEPNTKRGLLEKLRLKFSTKD